MTKYKINNIYNVDSYIAIKDIPDKSIDLVYIDVPYLYDSGGQIKRNYTIREERKRTRYYGHI